MSIEELVEIVPDFSMEDYLDIYIKNIDFSLFKDDIDIEKAIDIIRWTIDKYTEEIRNNSESFVLEEFEEDFCGYLDILRKSFYK